jgi:hypothetical protein
MSREFSQHLSELFQGNQNGDVCFAANDFQRLKRYQKEYSQLIDIHCKYNAIISYILIRLEDTPKEISFFQEGTITHSLESNEFGILLRIAHGENKFTIWLPAAPVGFCFDKHQRIVASSQLNLSYHWEIFPHLRLVLTRSRDVAETITFPFLVLQDPEGSFYDELRFLNDYERRLYRKTDWFFSRKPSAIWNYLINGSVYDPRSWKGIDKRFKCQQCAYAWWSYFCFLHEETGKKIYDVLQDEIAYSVLLDMSENGEWGHGYWSDDMETHARFHLDGIHLLISQYEKTRENIWLVAAERGMNFVFSHLTEFINEEDIWFLHDTLERQNSGLHARFKPKIFGKKLESTLCLNTHLQALTVLSRLRHILPENSIYLGMFDKGMRALQKVLDHRTAEFFYRPLMSLIIGNRVNVNKARNESCSAWDRLKNGLEWRLVQKIYWLLRRKFPRIVFPGGFIERDLNFSFFSEIYHIINLKDLLILYRREPFPWLYPYIKKGFAFEHNYIQKLGLEKALKISPYYIEYIDILCLYDRLIEAVASGVIDSTVQKIFQQTGGYSLDFYASEFVKS